MLMLEPLKQGERDLIVMPVCVESFHFIVQTKELVSSPIECAPSFFLWRGTLEAALYSSNAMVGTRHVPVTRFSGRWAFNRR